MVHTLLGRAHISVRWMRKGVFTLWKSAEDLFMQIASNKAICSKYYVCMVVCMSISGIKQWKNERRLDFQHIISIVLENLLVRPFTNLYPRIVVQLLALPYVFKFNLEIWNLSMQKRWSAVTTFSSSTPFKMGTDGVTKSRQQKMGPILRSHKKKCPKVRFLSWACRRRSGIVLPQPSYGAAASCLLLLQPVSTQDKYEHWTASV